MWDKRDDMVVHEVDPFNAEAPPYALAGQPLTPTEAFYSRNHGHVPEIDPAAWRLTVEGTAAPVELSLAELQSKFDPTTLAATLQCAGNRRTGLLTIRDVPGEAPWGSGATSTATWTGARLSDVLQAAGLDPDAVAHVAFAAPDVAEDAEPAQGYGSSIPLEKALSPEVLLAWEMNGAPLTAVHGAPVRVVVPGYIGARSVKWVQRIVVQPDPSPNYFQAVAYRLLPADADPANTTGRGFALGPVALSSDILRPEHGSVVPAGPTEIAGYAYVGDGRGVTRVDLSLDGGATWTEADLDEPGSRWTWRLWHATLDLPAGRHRLVVRAWDAGGTTQPESPATVWNPKGYVNSSWARVEVTAQPRKE